MSATHSNAQQTWVLVADEGHASLYELPAGDQGLRHVETLTDDDAHGRSAEFRRDAQGRRAPSVAGGSGGPGTAPQLGVGTVTSSASESEFHQEADNFARKVAEVLQERHQQGRYGELKIAAAPRFLGVLRKRLSAEVQGLITDEISKNLTGLDEGELTHRLFPDRAGPKRKLEPRAAQELRSGNTDIRH
jgi:protein required for attachment to host cells